ERLPSDPGEARRRNAQAIEKNSWRSGGSERNSSSARLMISIIPDRPAFMNNPATAISPPAGIGDHKPANQAVLDWVHEVELLTQPENIFWCDGSERENDFLISESLKQEVLIK